MARKGSKLITYGGPAGLVLGFLLGDAAHKGAAIRAALPSIEPIGKLWMNALSVAVVPLTICLLVCGVCSLPRGRALGSWGGRTLAWFVALLLLGAVFTVGATKLYFAFDPPQPITVGRSVALEVSEAKADWTEQLVPRNLFAATSKGDILPLAILATAFGLALRSLAEEKRKPVEALFSGVRDAVLVFVHWIVLAIPLGAFALAFSFAAESGLETASSLVHFTVYVCGLLALALVGVLVALFLASKRPVKDMAVAVSPLLAVAVGTRSSLASLPTLVESARAIELPEPASEIVLPTAVSVFKMNRTISSVAKLMFLSAALGLAASPQAMVVFIGTIVLLSFATPGLPAGGSNASWGAYMAAGLPLEAIVFVEVTDGITDILKTALNVVTDFAVAVFVSRAASRTRTSTSPTPLEASEEPAY